MDKCKDCEYRGYSPQLCQAHIKYCAKNEGKAFKPLPTSIKVGAKTIVGAGLGVAMLFFGCAAVSLVGGVALHHALLLKLSTGAGLTGGGIGFFKGFGKKSRDSESPRTKISKGEHNG